jgi:hypothetical protein
MNFYRYTADGGTVYRMYVDDAIALAMGFVAATGAEPILPDSISPRYGVFKVLVQGVRASIPFPFPTVPQALNLENLTVYVSGKAFQLSDYVGQKQALNPFAANGPQGLKGDKGDKGDQGIQGLKGDKGDKGDQGIQGLKGDKGEKGDQGIQGIQGIQGQEGPAGPAGTIAAQTQSMGADKTLTTAGSSGTLITFPAIAIGTYVVLAEASCESPTATTAFNLSVELPGNSSPIESAETIATVANQRVEISLAVVIQLTSVGNVLINMVANKANSIVRAKSLQFTSSPVTHARLLKIG